MSAGTLTLVFADRERRLVGLDAYTNAQRWQPAMLTVPSGPEGLLMSLASFDENGIAPGPTDSPLYRYDASSWTLAIDVQSGDPRQVCRCLTCAVAELGPDGELLTLFIEGVNIEAS